jgi:hypothetical protein
VLSKNSRKVVDGDAGNSSSSGVIFDPFAPDDRLGPFDGLFDVLIMTAEIKRQGKAFFFFLATRDLNTEQ